MPHKVPLTNATMAEIAARHDLTPAECSVLLTLVHDTAQRRWWSVAALCTFTCYSRAQVISALGTLRRRELATNLHSAHETRWSITTIGETLANQIDKEWAVS